LRLKKYYIFSRLLFARGLVGFEAFVSPPGAEVAAAAIVAAAAVVMAAAAAAASVSTSGAPTAARLEFFLRDEIGALSGPG
jgi:hypothetical protein